jgi:hypothetical protein
VNFPFIVGEHAKYLQHMEIQYGVDKKPKLYKLL